MPVKGAIKVEVFISAIAEKEDWRMDCQLVDIVGLLEQVARLSDPER